MKRHHDEDTRMFSESVLMNVCLHHIVLLHDCSMHMPARVYKTIDEGD